MKACLFLAAFLTLSPAVAVEQPPCAPWADMKRNLAEKYQEFQIGGGLINEKLIMAVFASAGGATWTTVGISVDGTACVFSVGTYWFMNKPAAPVPGRRES